MMTYYDDETNVYEAVSRFGRRRLIMTEEQAEEYQKEHPEEDVQAVVQVPFTNYSDAASDYLECSCKPDGPNETATLCPSCRSYFASMLD